MILLNAVLAQEQPQPPQAPPEGIYNPILPWTWGESGADIVALLIGKILNLLFMISGLILLLMIIISGIQWMLAGGSKESVAKAQGRLTSAIVGFIILASAFAIISLIANILNVEFLKTMTIEWPTL